MLVRRGMTVSLLYSILSRPRLAPSRSQQLTISTLIIPLRLHQIVPRGIEDRTLVVVAHHQPGGHEQAVIQRPVDVDQGNDLIATPPLVTLVPQIHLLRIHRVVVLIEQDHDRLQVVLVVGDKQIAGIADAEALLIE